MDLEGGIWTWRSSASRNQWRYATVCRSTRYAHRLPQPAKVWQGGAQLLNQRFLLPLQWNITHHLKLDEGINRVVGICCVPTGNIKMCLHCGPCPNAVLCLLLYVGEYMIHLKSIAIRTAYFSCGDLTFWKTSAWSLTNFRLQSYRRSMTSPWCCIARRLVSTTIV